jgi:hypothetical protein
MIALRTFTEFGIEQFKIYLSETIGSDSDLNPPDLNKEPFSKGMITPREILIDPKKVFKTRMDLGTYINQKLNLGHIDREDVLVKDPENWNNVWSWLAYIWADQFILKKNGAFTVPSTDRFIGSTDYRRFYRHFVATPYWLYSLHGEEYSKLFLDCPVTIHNELLEQIGSRQWIITSSNLVKLAHTLYWDTKKNVAKRGASSKGTGTVRRFAIIMNQFSLTYDIHTMDVAEILKLLPREFNDWKP